MRSLIQLALDNASFYGTSYADIRIVNEKTESISVRNGRIEEISYHLNQGFGIRILYNGSWGFASSFRLEKKEIERITKLAIKIAKASSRLKREDITLPHQEAYQDTYRSQYLINPFSVPIEKKLEILLAADSQMRKGSKKIKLTQSQIQSLSKKQIFANTEGSLIEQEIIACGGGIAATAVDGFEVQRRSYPNSFGGNYSTQGFEFVQSLKLEENAERIAQEAEALLKAPECPTIKTTVILDSSQMALQIHESIGHPTELDRVLGMEASFAGTSFVTLDKIGNFQYASEIVNITADATLKGGMGSFGYDDEGVKAQKVEIIKNGLLLNCLSSRETASVIGGKSNGTARADGWNRIPIVRMTNINLEPGDARLEEIISDTKEGLYLETNKSWSIDDKRLNFQFAMEMAREIKNGKLGRIYKNANYTGITPQFWCSCDAIANKKDWQLWGVLNCGKGEPEQVMEVGHGTPPARFRNVQVGLRK